MDTSVKDIKVIEIVDGFSIIIYSDSQGETKE